MIISVKKEKFSSPFVQDEYLVNLSRDRERLSSDDLVISGCPFGNALPLELSIAVKSDGTLAFRQWKFVKASNIYFHTRQRLAGLDDTPVGLGIKPTQEQIDTITGLWSERILFEGLKIPIGETIWTLCPIDTVSESKKLGKPVTFSRSTRLGLRYGE